MPKSSASKRAEPTLPDSELEVMRVLWVRRNATARDVFNALQQNGSKWTYATVNTLLQRLEAKGMAVSDKSAMTYIYSPRISRQSVQKRRVEQLVEKLYDGNGAPLVVHLLKSAKLSKDDMREINELLAQAEQS